MVGDAVMRRYAAYVLVTLIIAGCQSIPDIDPSNYDGWCYTFDLANIPIQNNPAVQPYFNIVEGVQVPSGLATGSNGQLSVTYVHDSIVEIEQVEADVQLDITAFIPGVTYDALGDIEVFGVQENVEFLNFFEDTTATLKARPGSANIAGSRASIVIVTDPNVTVRIKRLTVYGKSANQNPFGENDDNCDGADPTPTQTRIPLNTATPTPTGTQIPTETPTITQTPTMTETPDPSDEFYLVQVDWLLDADTETSQSGFWWQAYRIEERPAFGNSVLVGLYVDDAITIKPSSQSVSVVRGDNTDFALPERKMISGTGSRLAYNSGSGVTCVSMYMSSENGTNLCNLFAGSVPYDQIDNYSTGSVIGDKLWNGTALQSEIDDLQNDDRYLQLYVEETGGDGWQTRGELSVPYLIYYGEPPPPTPTPTITETPTPTETAISTATPSGSLEFYAVPVSILDGNISKTSSSNAVEGLFELDIPNTDHPLVGWLLKSDIQPDTQTVNSLRSNYGINLLVNGDFRYGFDNWFSNSGNINVVEVAESLQLQRVTSGGSNPWIAQITDSINSNTGESYGFAVDLSSNKPNTSASIVFRGLDASNSNAQPAETCDVTIGTSPLRTVFRVESIADWDNIQIRVQITDTDTSKVVTVDNAELRAVSSDFSGVDCTTGGTLPSALADLPLGASLAHDDLHCIVVDGFGELPCTTIRDNQYIEYDTFSVMNVAYSNNSNLSRWVGPLRLGASMTGTGSATANLTTAYAIFRRINLDTAGTLTPLPNGTETIPTSQPPVQTATAFVTSTAQADATAAATAAGTFAPL